MLCFLVVHNKYLVNLFYIAITKDQPNIKNLFIIASATLLSVALYAQDSAYNTIVNYNPNEAAAAGNGADVLLGELDSNKKSKRRQNITFDSKVAYYFENTTKQEGVALKSMLFKVENVKFKTEAHIRLYQKHDYVMDTYNPETGEKFSYNSFIPGSQIETGEIVVYIEPGQKGIVEVDLAKYDLKMPAEGVFVSVEGGSYYDAEGEIVANLNAKEYTQIVFHPTTTDNYCSWINPLDTENWFWINTNKLLKVDYEEVFKQKAPKKELIAPNFGLKVAMPN